MPAAGFFLTPKHEHFDPQFSIFTGGGSLIISINMGFYDPYSALFKLEMSEKHFKYPYNLNMSKRK